jgi:histone arginine demethylase JMJD6
MGNWEAKMERARRLHRPDLENWECDELYRSFPSFVKQLQLHHNFQRFFADVLDAENQKRKLPLALDAAKLTREEFYQYEIEGVPCVIKNIPAGYDGGEPTEPWPAHKRWQLEALKKDSTLLDRKFKCGEDDDERNIKIKLRDFLSYNDHNRDDSPLYIFDTTFDEDDYADRILKDYRVPSYFTDDLFGLVSESRRPPYRWFLVGPQRSGTCVHIDPLATSAWNTVLVGQKRWVIFPPYVPKSVVKGSGLVRDDEDDEGIHYFMNILPRIKRKARSLRGTPQYEGFCCYEFTQYAGETVFVPHGWWHAVLNLTDTVAITQNFCSRRNFDQVWLKTRTGRKKMAWKWLCKLEEVHPDLAERAKALNKRDDFVMKYDPEEIERREREEEEEEEEAEREEMGRDQKERDRKLEEKLQKQQPGYTSQSTWEREQNAPRTRGTPTYASDRELALKKEKRKRFDSLATVSP